MASHLAWVLGGVTVSFALGYIVRDRSVMMAIGFILIAVFLVMYHVASKRRRRPPK
jgi:predicted branched-subunit amino acid permease